MGRNKRKSIISALNASLRKHKHIIFYQTYKIKLDKVNSEGENVTTTAFLHLTNNRIFDKCQVGDERDESVNEVHKRLGQYMGEASGWILDVVENIHLSISVYHAIRGSSYIPTPTRLKGKQAIINVVNRKDDRCFEYSILASKYADKKHQNRVSRYKDYLDELNTEGIEMPMATKDITKFEKMNPEYIINVYSCNSDGTNIQPRRISKIRDKTKKIVNLLMLS